MSRQLAFVNRLKVWACGTDLSAKTRSRISRGGFALPAVCIYTAIGTAELAYDIATNGYFFWDYRLTSNRYFGVATIHPSLYLLALSVTAAFLLRRWFLVAPDRSDSRLRIENGPIAIALLLVGLPMWREVLPWVSSYVTVFVLGQTIWIGLTGRPWGTAFTPDRDRL